MEFEGGTGDPGGRPEGTRVIQLSREQAPVCRQMSPCLSAPSRHRTEVDVEMHGVTMQAISLAGSRPASARRREAGPWTGG